MADLKSDIVGRVARLPLRPSERGALLPLMEAISNSVFSITERFGEEAVKKGRIAVSLIRNEESPDRPIIGFDIEDNGVGFTADNYRSFLTPDSRWKESRGGKGVGRLAWLKVFQKVSITSTYIDGTINNRRSFNFRLSETDQVEELEDKKCVDGEIKTIIKFRNFEGNFAGKCPAKSETIASRIISHFVPLFVAGNAPRIIMIDDENIDIEALFTEDIKDQHTDTIPFVFDGEDVELKLSSLKCNKKVKFDGGGHNFLFITGNNRSVIDYSVDEQLGLKTLDGDHIYIGCASSPYLDRHVNAERTAFTLENKEIDEIKRAIAQRARQYLSEYINHALTEKVRTTRSIVSENPQFLYVIPELSKFVEKLQPNAFKKEDIFVELSRDRFRRHKTFDIVKSELKSNDAITDTIKDKIASYKAFIQDEKKGALAEYVMRRKAVLDLFESLLQYNDQEKETYSKEDAVHQLVCPMRIEGNKLTIDDHNLWMVDDRLAFFNYFASDLELNKYANVESADRPDLAFFYDSCVAWRERENTDTVVIVEFKRPMREDYSKGKDPVQQVLGYVKKLKEEKTFPDINGKAIRGINPSTAFHCYIIADITPQLEDKLMGRLNRTPDGEGLFGYQTNPDAFVEIIPFGKLLKDARLKSTVFFHKLGITDAG